MTFVLGSFPTQNGAVHARTLNVGKPHLHTEFAPLYANELPRHLSGYIYKVECGKEIHKLALTKYLVPGTRRHLAMVAQGPTQTEKQGKLYCSELCTFHLLPVPK